MLLRISTSRPRRAGSKEAWEGFLERLEAKKPSRQATALRLFLNSSSSRNQSNSRFEVGIKWDATLTPWKITLSREIESFQVEPFVQAGCF